MSASPKWPFKGNAHNSQMLRLHLYPLVRQRKRDQGTLGTQIRIKVFNLTESSMACMLVSIHKLINYL